MNLQSVMNPCSASPSSPAPCSPCTASAGSSVTSTTSCAIWPMRGVETTLITRTPKPRRRTGRDSSGRHASSPCRITRFRGRPSRHDRARSQHGVSALRTTGRTRGAGARRRGERIDIVHGLGASVLGYARDARAQQPRRSCSTRRGSRNSARPIPSRARLKRAGYLPLRRAVLACARAADRIIATDRSLEPVVLAASRRARGTRARHSQRARPRARSIALATPADGGARPPRRRHWPRRCRAAQRRAARREQGLPRPAAALGALRDHGGRLPKADGAGF